jgi:hypothetical protein
MLVSWPMSGVAVASDINVLPWREWPVVGTAQFSKFFFDIYQVELLTPSGKFNPIALSIEQYADGDDQLALSIVYQRDISAKQLLDATQQQWQHLGLSEKNVTEWLIVLEPIFPDVVEGDRLTYWVNSQGGHFYLRHTLSGTEQKIGEIQSVPMSKAFLSIWLSPLSEYPKLQQQLIGAN